MMLTPDTMHRFLIEDSDVRGQCVHLDQTWRSVLEQASYPPRVREVLAEAITALALLSATLKYEGSITLQLSGDGPLYLLIAHCTSDGVLRGLARWRGDTEQCSFKGLVGKSILTMTIDPGPGKDRYQGIVAVEEDCLAAVLQAYFDHSEQLPTRLWLASDESASAGLLLQKLPGTEIPDDHWQRLARSTTGVTSHQLLTLPVSELLTNLYARDTLRLFSGKTVRYGCHCSRERAGNTVVALGRDEFRPELDRGEPVHVDCEFCNQRYVFDAVDLAILFRDMALTVDDDRRH